MLNIAITVTFKLIIIIMLLYILAYIVDMIYLEVYLYPKILKDEMEKEKLLIDENVKIIDINIDDDMDKVFNDFIKKMEERDEDDE